MLLQHVPGEAAPGHRLAADGARVGRQRRRGVAALRGGGRQESERAPVVLVFGAAATAASDILLVHAETPRSEQNICCSFTQLPKFQYQTFCLLQTLPKNRTSPTRTRTSGCP